MLEISCMPLFSTRARSGIKISYYQMKCARNRTVGPLSAFRAVGQVFPCSDAYRPISISSHSYVRLPIHASCIGLHPVTWLSVHKCSKHTVRIPVLAIAVIGFANLLQELIGGTGVGVRLIVGFQPLMVVSPTASWIRCMVYAGVCEVI